jgi:pyruvate dehydrogenase E1 component
MYADREDIFYYVTLENEPYAQPPKPPDCKEGVLKGLYLYKAAEKRDGRPSVHLFGSGAILNEALKANELLAGEFGIASDVWSVTSYTELQRDAAKADHWNATHPGQPQHTGHLLDMVGGDDDPIIAASDYVRNVPDQIAPWLGGRLFSLGTDGFGRSDTREALRAFFGVDAAAISFAAVAALAQRGQLPESTVYKSMQLLRKD